LLSVCFEGLTKELFENKQNLPVLSPPLLDLCPPAVPIAYCLASTATRFDYDGDGGFCN
jgi:hypothetical protein